MERIATPVETEELCHYGCGCQAKFRNGSGNLMCLPRSNSCPAIKSKNAKGLSKAHADGKMRTDFGGRPNRIPPKKPQPIPRFSKGGTGPHKKFLIEERGHQCEICLLTTWLDRPVPLEMDHIDGDHQNNEKVNLRLLCPNCHSTTDTYRGRNISKKRKETRYVSDEEFISALRSTKNIRQALIKLDLTPKGANYVRAHELSAELR